ncbi:MAG: AraC family transcriptional regulator [Oscillospiraceae bacterium]|nr:AraC family transcriptional regulator [Oscillospiraceae bacterium]
MYKNDPTCFENTFSFPYSRELNMYYCGKRILSPNHSYGPEVRRHFLVVYIKEGQATLLSHKDKIRLVGGNLFVMFPNEEIHYVVDKNSLWTISWVGLYGNMVYDLFESVGITPENPVKSVKNIGHALSSIFEGIYQLSFSMEHHDKLSVISLLYQFFSVLISDNGAKTSIDYVEEAARLIDYNYDKNITVENIAERLFINKSYLSRLFKSKKGITPKEYLIKKRLDRAADLLINSTVSVNTIAISVGLSDPLYFSRIFKKHTGLSPSQYRQSEAKQKNL